MHRTEEDSRNPETKFGLNILVFEWLVFPLDSMGFPRGSLRLNHVSRGFCLLVFSLTKGMG